MIRTTTQTTTYKLSSDEIREKFQIPELIKSIATIKDGERDALLVCCESISQVSSSGSEGRLDD